MDDSRTVGGHVDGTSSWSREFVELAALFLAVGTADLFANTLAHHRAGTIVLFALGALLIGAAVLQRWWRRRHRGKRVEPARVGTAARSSQTSSAVWRVRTTVRDIPGGLAALAYALARRDVNIVSLQAHPVSDGVVDELLVRAPGELGEADILAAVEDGGGGAAHVDAADVHELVDAPTQVLGLATELAAGRLDLPHALRSLLGATVREDDPGGDHPGDGTDGAIMRLPVPGNKYLVLCRRTAFTPAELARAHALLTLHRAVQQPARSGERSA